MLNRGGMSNLQLGDMLGESYFMHAAGGTLGLQTNLTAFWSLENTSWTDDTGNGTTLTGHGTPTVTTGVAGGNGLGTLDGTTQYLSAASNTNVSNGGGSFSVQAWVKTTAAPGGEVVFNKDNNAFGQREWGLGSRFTSSNVWSFTLSNTSTSFFNADSAVTVVTGSFVHLVGTFNSSTGAITIYVNGTASGAGATLTGTVQSSASAPISIGSLAGATFMPAGVIDQVGFWKGRVLSSSDVTALYNSGAGLTYAAMV